MDRQWLSHPLFARERLYSRLHDGAGLHGRARTGIRQTRLQDYRAERRSRGQPQHMEIGHRGDAAPQGDDVIILPAVTEEEAKQKSPGGWKPPKPYLRIVPQPK